MFSHLFGDDFSEAKGVLDTGQDSGNISVVVYQKIREKGRHQNLICNAFHAPGLEQGSVRIAY